MIGYYGGGGGLAGGGGGGSGYVSPLCVNFAGLSPGTFPGTNPPVTNPQITTPKAGINICSHEYILYFLGGTHQYQLHAQLMIFMIYITYYNDDIIYSYINV